MPEELTRDERAGPCSQPGSLPRARPDVEEPAHRRAVPGLSRERPPEKVLVECKRARVGIAVLEVDVRRLQVCGREHDALADRRLEVRDVLCDALLDAVRVALAQRLAPGSVACVELTGRIA